MSNRRSFLKLAAPAAGMALAIEPVAYADAAPGSEFVGTWNTIHSLPFPPGYFREFLAFSQGGVLQETNSFLNTASNLDFSAFGLPAVLNASDGMGNWTRVSKGVAQVVFRKLLFDGSRHNVADLLVTGEWKSNGKNLSGIAHIVVIDNATNNILFDFGQASSEGIRLLS
jgi:hypothetical protein